MTQDPERRAFDREGLAGRVAPFAAAAAGAVLVGFIGIETADPAWLATGAITTAATIVLALTVPWRSLPRWVEVTPPLLYMLAVVAIRHASGGASSGFSPVFLVPILWLALFGTRPQLAAGIAVLTAALVVPIVIVGEPHYPFVEWRRVILLVLVGATLGLIVQELVRQAQQATARALAQARELAEQRDVTEAIFRSALDAIVSIDWSGTVVSANAAADTLFHRTDLVGRDVFDALVPPNQMARLREGFARLLTDHVPTGRESRFDAELQRGDGRVLPVEISLARTEGPGGLRIHAFVRDTTAQRAAEQSRTDHLDDLDRLLIVTRDVSRAGVDGRRAVCLAARDLSGADFVLLFTIGPVGERLVVAGSSTDQSAQADVTLDPDRSVTAQVLRTGTAVFSPDLATDTRVDTATALQLGAAAAYWQPVTRDDVPIGVLVAYWRQPLATLPERAATLLGLFAEQAATVLERSDLLARLEDLARTDALTGAANRRALDEALEIALADARRSGRPVSLTMLDLDHFKRYNDTHGHQAGDLMLRATAAAWIHELRPGDVLARYGGEEFLAVLRACDVAGAVVVADRMRAVVPGPQTASAGTATWDGTETVASLIARADVALYQAKDAGRDRTISSEARDVQATKVDPEPRP